MWRSLLNIYYFKEVSHMNNYSVTLKQQLFAIIDDMATSRTPFVNDPGKDFIRTRKLTLTELIRFLLSLGGSNLSKELLEYFSYDETTPSVSALFQQRAKLKPYAFEYLFKTFTDISMPINLKSWNNYRLIAVDGSTIILPIDSSNPDTFTQPKPNAKGFNQIHLNALYDLCNSIYLDASCQYIHSRDERRAFVSMLDNASFESSTIFIADRGYCTYNDIAHVQEAGCHYLMRSKDITSNGIAANLPYPESDEFDFWITQDLTRKSSKAVRSKYHNYKLLSVSSTFDYLDNSDQEAYTLTYRVTRFKLDDSSYEVVFSNLDTDEFPPSVLKDLYYKRWGIETSFRQLKYSVGLVNFHSKKVDYILQEIYSRLILYNFCELITWPVVITKDFTKHSYKVNFTRTVEICKYFLSKRSYIKPPDVEVIIKRYTIPIRKDRKYPRKIQNQPAVYFIYRIA